MPELVFVRRLSSIAALTAAALGRGARLRVGRRWFRCAAIRGERHGARAGAARAERRLDDGACANDGTLPTLSCPRRWRPCSPSTPSTASRTSATTGVFAGAGLAQRQGRRSDPDARCRHPDPGRADKHRDRRCPGCAVDRRSRPSTCRPAIEALEALAVASRCSTSASLYSHALGACADGQPVARRRVARRRRRASSACPLDAVQDRRPGDQPRRHLDLDLLARSTSPGQGHAARRRRSTSAPAQVLERAAGRLLAALPPIAIPAQVAQVKLDRLQPDARPTACSSSARCAPRSRSPDSRSPTSPSARRARGGAASAASRRATCPPPRPPPRSRSPAPRASSP